MTDHTSRRNTRRSAEQLIDSLELWHRTGFETAERALRWASGSSRGGWLGRRIVHQEALDRIKHWRENTADQPTSDDLCRTCGEPNDEH